MSDYENLLISKLLSKLKKLKTIPKDSKFLLDFYQNNIDTNVNNSNLNILIINTVCHGFGDIVFSMKIFKILKIWYPNLNIKIASTKINNFLTLGTPKEILLELKDKTNAKECNEIKNLEFVNENEKYVIYDLIFIAPLFTDSKFSRYIDVKSFLPYSNRYNTYYFSEYNVKNKEKFDFPTGIGDGNFGMLFLDDDKEVYKPLPEFRDRKYIVVYIANISGAVECFNAFIKMIVKKYAHEKDFDIVVPVWVNYEMDIEPIVDDILKYFDIIKLKTKDKLEILAQSNRNTSKKITFRADIFPQEYNNMKNLFYFSEKYVLVTGDQSITDVLACCWNDKIPFYQTVQWKKEFAYELGKELPQKFLQNIETSCGNDKAISYFDKNSPNFSEFIDKWDFKKLAKSKMNSIIKLSEDKKGLKYIKNIINIFDDVFTGNDSLKEIIYRIENLDQDDIQKTCDNLPNTKINTFLKDKSDRILLIKTHKRKYFVECLEKNILKNNEYICYNLPQKFYELILLGNKIFLTENDINNIINSKFSIFYIEFDKKLNEPGCKIDLYKIKVCGNEECLKNIF